jgi:Short repeat of unknown function (DUF308)
MSGRSIHSLGTVALSALMAVIGVALLAQALAAGVISTRLLLGGLFLVAGLGRLYVESRRRRRPPPR